MNLDRVIAVRNKKTIFRDGDRCIKVFNADYLKADVLNEALNHARAEGTGLNIPEILEISKIDGKWAIVSVYIKGKTLSQLTVENSEKKKQYIDVLVDIQRDVHEKTAPLLTPLKDKFHRKIDETDLSAGLKEALHKRLSDMPEDEKVCHGDFSLSNIIIAEDKTPYILDWSHATRGNVLADVARTYLLFWLEGDISGAEYYLDSFCKKSGVEKQTLMEWMPLVAASRLKQGNEKEREFLMSWVCTDEQL